MIAEELREHADSIITISVTAELQAVADLPPWKWAEGPQMLDHYYCIARSRAYALGMELAPGPAERWVANGEAFFSYPLMPRNGALPWTVQYWSVLPKWGDDRVPQAAWLA